MGLQTKDTKKTMMKKKEGKSKPKKKDHMTKLLKVKGDIFFLSVESSCEREVREAAKHNRKNSKRENHGTKIG